MQSLLGPLGTASANGNNRSYQMNWSNEWRSYQMNWSNEWTGSSWPTAQHIDTSNPLDKLSQDELLVLWQSKKDALAKAKDDEMDLRKYIVGRAFPDKQEGMNTIELGNGYELKATVKFNYNLADNNIVEKTLDKIAKIGNQGAFIAERLVSWTPSFKLTEYRDLVAAGPVSAEAQEILSAIGEMLVITDAAPTLVLKEPKVKK